PTLGLPRGRRGGPMKTLARPADKAEVLARLRSLRPDSARRWGRMSAHQAVCHLADALRMVVGDKAVSRGRGWMTLAVVKWIALYAPLPWPHGILTRPEVDQEGGGTRPTEFAADATALEELVETFAGPMRTLDGRAHPLFGPMSDAAWLRWGY